MPLHTIRSSTAVLALAAFLISACEQPQPEAPVEEVTSTDLPTGYWQAAITLPGGDIETGIEIAEDDGNYSASLVNGQERVLIDDVRYLDGELVLRFPAFNNEIRAMLSDGELNGDLTLVKRFGATQAMPFTATPGGAATAAPGAQANHDLSGRWAVRFHEPDGSDSASIGEFAQRGSRLFGTFLNPNGDHRFLAGHVRGDDFHLSTFDGSHAFIFSGSINGDGEIVNADFWSGTSWHQQWSAERNDSVELPDAFSRTFLKPGYDRFEFSFPNEAGDVVSIDDERFKAKVLMVSLAGTWCPNCNDEAAFLAPFHKQYRDQGLEVVGLMFEHFEDATIASEQVRLFRDKHDIEYDTLIAGISDKTEAGKVLPALSSVLAFPTTIFIDRSGRVRQIHTGFTGPGTGEHYVQLQSQFTELVTELLAEPPDLIESLANDEI
ncbi:MAG: TlpA disulfide reductase family protein [Woeseiaceae bacterium]